MSDLMPIQNNGIGDETYLKLWEMEQQHSSKRWTVATFFFGISFAILGFSFQTDKAQVPLIIQHIAAIISYWFAYMLFLRFNDFTNFLRDYLKELESSNRVSLKIQLKVREYMKRKKRVSTTRLLRYFGIVYTIGIIVTWIFL